MNVFAKIFSQIFDSSISSDYMVRHVFMDLLVLADRDGIVDMTTDAISRRTNVPEDAVIRAIEELTKADRKSRSHTEDGRRLVLIDSHRDWGWQIVNYEHYRNIKDEEARRTYFRDKQREHRAKSTFVKDNTTESKEITQGELEGDVLPLREPDSGSELALASWLFDELSVPADNGTRRIAAECIRLMAREGGTTRTAATYILKVALQAKADGATINRFWFSDQKYQPQKENTNGRSGKSKRGVTGERLKNTRIALAEALAKRGVDVFGDASRTDGAEVSEPGERRVDGGVSDRLRAVGPEILPPKG